MRIEELGAPTPCESPERRYASLHRTIEAGTATDRTWFDLMEVCLALHKPDEAMTACGCINDRAIHERAQRMLLQSGAQGEKRALPTEQPSVVSAKDHSNVMEDDDESIAENITDAFRFLFTESMPLTVIFATLTFPLVVGFGGFLTKDSHALVFPLIALIPALSVVGLIGALGRRILLDAQQDLDEAPTIPAIATLTRDAGRFLVDATVLGLVFLAPGILVAQADGLSPAVWISTLGLGAYLLPMALALRAATDDWRCLTPNVLFSSVTRCGLRYAAFAGCAIGLFLPAGISAYFAHGTQMYLQIAVVGPLTVAPLFVVARLLGQLLYLQRRELQEFLTVSTTPRATLKDVLQAKLDQVSQRRAQMAAVQAAAKAREQQRVSRRTLGAARHPEAARAQAVDPRAAAAAAAAKPAPHKQRRPAPTAASRPAQPPADTHPADQYGAPQRARAPQRPLVGAAAPARAAAAQGVAAQGVATRVDVQEVADPSVGAGMPDLSQIPGAHVVRGSDRVRAGAAARDTDRGRRP